MSLKLEIDWSRDGYGSAVDDITDYVRQTVSIDFGRDQSTALAPTVSGRGGFALDNVDRRFSPRAATLADGSANPLYGKIKPARPVRLTRRNAGPAPTPTAVIGLALWFKSSDLSGLADGAAVTSWSSKVGTSTATQAVGTSQPTKRTVGDEVCVRFDGADDFLSLGGDALTVTQNVAGVSIFVRAKPSTTPTFGDFVSFSTGTAANTRRAALRSAADALQIGGRRLDADSFQGVSGGSLGTAQIHVVAGIINYAATTASAYVNGVLAGSTTSFQSAGSTSNTASLAAALGARPDGAIEWVGMDLYEVLVWPRVLTDAERTFVEAYLNWGRIYALFVGHTDDQPINPDVSSQTVSIGLVDSLADFRGQTISTGLYAGVRTGQAIGVILDACGWSSSLRDLDSGATVIPWFWCDGKDALTALEEIIRSEGPPALLTVGSSGEIVFRDRHHRLTRAASITSQGTWRGSGSLEPAMEGYSYNEGWANIVNTGSVSVEVRTPQPLQVIWTSDTTISLSAGEEKLITASVTDPFYGAVAPVGGVDYAAVGTVTTTLFRTSGASATIKLTAVGPAVVSNLQLRAQPVTVAYTVQVSASDVASIADFGPRSFPGDLPWCNPYDAQAVLDTAVAIRSQPLPILSVRFMVGNNATKAAAVLARDMSDRVTVIEPETVVNGDFYVETIGHSFTGEYDHEVTFGLEAAQIPITPVFRFDLAGAGFDQGKFGQGLDEAATMFRFDLAGAGFDQGKFAS